MFECVHVCVHVFVLSLFPIKLTSVQWLYTHRHAHTPNYSVQHDWMCDWAATGHYLCVRVCVCVCLLLLNHFSAWSDLCHWDEHGVCIWLVSLPVFHFCLHGLSPSPAWLPVQSRGSAHLCVHAGMLYHFSKTMLHSCASVWLVTEQMVTCRWTHLPAFCL